jgi:AraC-like DNA-binding protein
MVNWRKLTPVYANGLSTATLLAEGRLFSMGDAHLTNTDHQPPHWHETYEIGYVCSGAGIIVLGQREYSYRPGQVYIINDLDPHMGYTEEPYSRLFCVHFHPAILDEGWIGHMRGEARLPFLPDFGGAHGPLIPLDDPVTAPVRGILQQIREEALHREVVWEVIVGGMILEATGYLARRLIRQVGGTVEDRQRRESLKRIGAILRMIDERYAEPLTLDEIAGAAHLSRSHCCALFRLALGTSPIAYRNARRLAEARHLLQSTDIPVHEIARQVGFSSVQEFNRLFRRESGVTPTRYRARG